MSSSDFYNYKPFIVFDRFKLRDVYLSVCRRYLLPQNYRFLRPKLFMFGIVGKILARIGFLHHFLLILAIVALASSEKVLKFLEI
jgi:hypothetical protein